MIRRCYVILCMFMFFLTINSQTVNQLIRVGNKQYSQKDYVHAEISYRKVLNKDNNNIVACYNLARTLQAQNKDSEAKILYEKVIKLKEASSARVSSYYNLGTLLQKEKNYGGAIETYKNVLRIDPNHNKARYNLELCKKQQQQKKKHSAGGRNKSNKNQKKNQKRNGDNKNGESNQAKNRNSMSRDNAQQLLNAAMQQEKETQERLSKAMKQPSDRKLDKNW